jgi:hypothetical protein
VSCAGLYSGHSAEAGHDPVSAPDPVVADAGTHRFASGDHDLVESRFVATLFDEPVPAFAKLRSAARPGRRLVAGIWQPWDGSEFQVSNRK